MNTLIKPDQTPPTAMHDFNQIQKLFMSMANPHLNSINTDLLNQFLSKNLTELTTSPTHSEPANDSSPSSTSAKNFNLFGIEALTKDLKKESDKQSETDTIPDDDGPQSPSGKSFTLCL